MTLDAARARLAEAVQTRRLTLGWSIESAAGRVGMSPTTWARVEAGENVRKLTYAGVDHALGWEGGGCLKVLQGLDPVVLPTPSVEEEIPSQYPDDPVLRYLWETPDPSLTDAQREALVQVYRALKRTADRPGESSTMGQVRQFGT